MADNNGRWGISLLSKSKYLNAKTEEVMMDKRTGEICVKDDNGNIISYDYLSRRQNTINRCITLANNSMLRGAVYLYKGLGDFNIDYYPTIFSIEGNDTIVDVSTSLIIKMDHSEAMMIYLDMDVIDLSNGGVINDTYPLNVTYSLSDNEVVTVPIETFNSKTHYIDETVSNDEINISSFSVTKENEKDICIIIYGIYMITDNILGSSTLPRDYTESTARTKISTVIDLNNIEPSSIELCNRFLFDNIISPIEKYRNGDTYTCSNGIFVWIWDDNSRDFLLKKCPSEGSYTLEDIKSWENVSLSKTLSVVTTLSKDPNNSFSSKTTSFNSDGSITVSYNTGYTVNTSFNSDGSITETVIDSKNNVIKTTNTIFNSDGSITESIS
jgi:hypothetical protein